MNFSVQIIQSVSEVAFFSLNLLSKMFVLTDIIDCIFLFFLKF
jgi:hypothetical protein